MHRSRTTLSADSEDLKLLRAEAERRGVSLASLLGGLVRDEANALRARHRPRFGVAGSGAGAGRAATEREKEPLERRNPR